MNKPELDHADLWAYFTSMRAPRGDKFISIQNDLAGPFETCLRYTKTGWYWTIIGLGRGRWMSCHTHDTLKAKLAVEGYFLFQSAAWSTERAPQASNSGGVA